MYNLVLAKEAQKDIRKLQKDKRLMSKLFEILRDIEQNPYSPAFKMEKLKYNFQDHYSKRLDKKNRVIYQVFEDKILVSVISILGHYDD